MKTISTIAVLLASVGVVFAADKPLDLTGADAGAFKTQIGKTVTLRGQLMQGKQGPCLHGATPTNVSFYIIPEIPPSGSYTYPDSWNRLMYKQVRVTGELMFRPFDQSTVDSSMQAPSDYYYMVLQHMTIERIQDNRSTEINDTANDKQPIQSPNNP